METLKATTLSTTGEKVVLRPVRKMRCHSLDTMGMQLTTRKWRSNNGGMIFQWC